MIVYTAIPYERQPRINFQETKPETNKNNQYLAEHLQAQKQTQQAKSNSNSKDKKTTIVRPKTAYYQKKQDQEQNLIVSSIKLQVKSPKEKKKLIECKNDKNDHLKNQNNNSIQYFDQELMKIVLQNTDQQKQLIQKNYSAQQIDKNKYQLEKEAKDDNSNFLKFNVRFPQKPSKKKEKPKLGWEKIQLYDPIEQSPPKGRPPPTQFEKNLFKGEEDSIDHIEGQKMKGKQFMKSKDLPSPILRPKNNSSQLKINDQQSVISELELLNQVNNQLDNYQNNKFIKNFSNFNEEEFNNLDDAIHLNKKQLQKQEEGQQKQGKVKKILQNNSINHSQSIQKQEKINNSKLNSVNIKEEDEINMQKQVNQLIEENKTRTLPNGLKVHAPLVGEQQTGVFKVTKGMNPFLKDLQGMKRISNDVNKLIKQVREGYYWPGDINEHDKELNEIKDKLKQERIQRKKQQLGQVKDQEKIDNIEAKEQNNNDDNEEQQKSPTSSKPDEEKNLDEEEDMFGEEEVDQGAQNAAGLMNFNDNKKQKLNDQKTEQESQQLNQLKKKIQKQDQIQLDQEEQQQQQKIQQQETKDINNSVQLTSKTAMMMNDMLQQLDVSPEEQIELEKQQQQLNQDEQEEQENDNNNNIENDVINEDQKQINKSGKAQQSIKKKQTNNLKNLKFNLASMKGHNKNVIAQVKKLIESSNSINNNKNENSQQVNINDQKEENKSNINKEQEEVAIVEEEDQKNKQQINQDEDKKENNEIIQQQQQEQSEEDQKVNKKLLWQQEVIQGAHNAYCVNDNFDIELFKKDLDPQLTETNKEQIQNQIQKHLEKHNNQVKQIRESGQPKKTYAVKEKNEKLESVNKQFDNSVKKLKTTLISSKQLNKNEEELQKKNQQLQQQIDKKKSFQSPDYSKNELSRMQFNIDEMEKTSDIHPWIN